jgi:mono/diheme cytochrome c family protein
LLPEGSRRVRQRSIGEDNAMNDDHAPMARYIALIEQLCSRRSTLVQAMAANPEQITDEQIRDLAWLQSAFAAVEAEHRRAEREMLHEEVQQRTGTLPSLP